MFEIKKTGLTKDTFSIDVQPEVGDLVSTDIRSELLKGRDADEQVASQSWWQAVAAYAREDLLLFEQLVYNVRMAHYRRYVRYIIIASEMRETLQLYSDLISEVFSSSLTEEDKDRFVKQAFAGFQMEKRGLSLKQVKEMEFIGEDIDRFKMAMYSVGSYDELVREFAEKKRKKEIVDVMVNFFFLKGIFMTKTLNLHDVDKIMSERINEWINAQSQSNLNKKED
jgi:hypothetical protein